MSPEYALNNIVSTKLDVWSYGILVWEVFSRKTAPIYFSDECWKNRLEFATEIEFSKILEEILNKCWEFNFEKRPDIGEILHAIESYYRNENSSSSQ
jgi:serine/threonine protein kinase